MTDFDYVIVGGGSAGCVLAYRLSQDPACSVLLIEAGGSGQHPFVQMPKGIAKAMSNLKLIWPYMTQGEPATGGVGESWARGRALGGSSAVNGMVYVRGQDADFDTLAQLTSEEWGWAKIADAYTALENHELGADTARGDAGPLHVTLPDFHSPVVEAAVAAGEQSGLARLEDVNAPADRERIGFVPRTIYRGRRETASSAFLDPIRARRNLTIVTHVVVDRIEFDGKRAVAVIGRQDDRQVRYAFTRDVILTAGTMASPAILQRSGVGPAELLGNLGIPVVQDLPQVGENLREHRGFVMQWKVPDDASQNREYRGWRLFANVIRYYLGLRGPMTTAAYEAGAWVKGSEASERPDVQILIAPTTFDFTAPKVAVEPHGGMNCVVYGLRPDSTGTVRITSREATALPEITSNYCATQHDRDKVVQSVRAARKLAQTGPLKDLIVEETRPGPAYQSDEEILEAHRNFGYGSYHACGTCRMGKDDGSVVDPHLRVRGVEGVRVADTSVFPFMLSGNTNGPAMAVAWRAADLIVAD